VTSVLVTGGAGFIGSHLTEALVHGGCRVTVVDSMQFCHPDNLDAALRSGRVELRREDCAADGWRVSGDFDEIFHLAGVVATGEFMARPVAALWTSLMPMEQILRYQRDRRPRVQVLFASSSEVYGDAQVDPQGEDYRGSVSITGPRSGYDEGKRATESLIAGWARERRLPAVAAVVRLFNTYGARMTANGRLVPTMVVDALRHGRIVVNVPGTQTRTLLYVSDCVTALRRAMAVQSPQPINVGGLETMSVRVTAEHIAAAVGEMTGRTVRIESGPAVPDDIMQRRPDLRRVREVLAWSPAVCFADGIKHVIDYWRKRAVT
jgi:nucleoside-diphosphate-sugar epimerase